MSAHNEQGVPRLSVTNVSKTFGDRTVLKDVHLTVMPGELHGIIGQNGSGKSTLAKVISGYHAPDPGASIQVDGQDLHVPIRLKDLRAASVSIVYQDLGLIPDANVLENVRIGTLKRGRFSGRVDWQHEGQAARPALDRLGFTHPLTTPVADLPPASRAEVAIARAMQDHQQGRGLILFDEATRALPLDALEAFYGTVRQLLRDGTSALLIAHHLEEILKYCDRVTVLRDGELVAAGIPTAGLTEGDLARTMLGRTLATLSFDARPPAPAPQVSLRGIRGGRLTTPVDLDLGAGEVVGVTGLPGSGFETLPYLIAGARKPALGTVTLGEEQVELTGASLAEMVKRGVLLVPENRLGDGLSAEHDVMANITLPWMERHARPWWLGRGWRLEQTGKIIDQLGVVPRDPHHLIARLSGGNQQKVLLGKWLAGRPRLLLLHEPTQAVDVKARQDLLTAIHRVAAEGTSVLIASTEVADLSLLCDRVLVFHSGSVDVTIDGEFDEHTILDATYDRPTNGAAPGSVAADRDNTQEEESGK